MKKIAVSLIAIFLMTFNSYAEEITVASGEWEPFAGGKLNNFGYFNDVFKEAMKLEGVEVKFDFRPWKRTEVEVLRGKYVATPGGWIKSPEREKDFIFNEEVLYSGKLVFFILKEGAFDWNTLEDIKAKGFKVGTDRGDISFSELQAAGVNVEGIANYEKNFKKLLYKRIDAVSMDQLSGMNLINKMPKEDQDKIVIHPKAYAESPTYTMFSKNHPKGQYYRDKLDSGLRKLKESGKFDRMLSDLYSGKYSISD